MVLVIDNYDSFTYNLVQYLEELGARTITVRNDKTDINSVYKMNVERIVISPGPGRPEDAGISCAVIKEFYKKMPVLGVCLGHQCIGYIFGARINRAKSIMHGKTSSIKHNGEGIFKNMSNPFVATRYHSLVVSGGNLPKNLKVTAQSEDGTIMGLRERNFPLYGVQFHPESILTEQGKKLLDNFLNL